MVIGEGMLKAELQKNYPTISFLGWLDKVNMIEQYKKTRCLIFPSIWYETFGLVPIESMTLGVPVICSDVNSAKDFIINEKNGLTYHGYDLEDLKKKINICKNDVLIQKLSEGSLSYAKKFHFECDKYIDNLLLVYRSIFHDLS